MGAYFRPDRLESALHLLGTRPLVPLAGGTDVYPSLASRAAWGKPSDPDFLDLSNIEELSRLREEEEGYRIGALVTWSALLEAGLPPWFEGLRQAAREVGGQQIQNRGTLAGNLCNASPAADGVPPLLALGAEVELASRAERRRLPLAEFLRGNRKTARRPDELMTAILVPRPRHPARSLFLKLGARRYLVISIVMAAVTLESEQGEVAAARAAVGACSPVACRLPELERALLGRPLWDLASVPQPDMLGPLSPIDDVRARGAYRAEAALTLLRRALAALEVPEEAAA